MDGNVAEKCCGTCDCAKMTGESVVAMRYTLRQAADALRAGERDLAENMIHKALAELENYTND
jgi:hypothetical protein